MLLGTHYSQQQIRQNALLFNTFYAVAHAAKIYHHQDLFFKQSCENQILEHKFFFYKILQYQMLRYFLAKIGF